MTDRLDAQLRALAHALVDEARVPTAFQTAKRSFAGCPGHASCAIVVAIAACLVVALVVGGALLLSAGNDPSSVQTAAGASGGCAGKAYVADQGDGSRVGHHDRDGRGVGDHSRRPSNAGRPTGWRSLPMASTRT